MHNPKREVILVLFLKRFDVAYCIFKWTRFRFMAEMWVKIRFVVLLEKM